MKTYEQALEEIKNIEVKSKVIKNFFMNLDLDDLDFFAEKVKEGIFLPEIFKDKIHLKSVGLPILLILFDEKEVEEYFIKCCIKLHQQNCQVKWIKPELTPYFRSILGYYGTKKNLPFPQFSKRFKIFNKHFDNFFKEDIYPDEIVEEIIKTIKNRETFQESIQNLKQFCQKNKTTIAFLDIIEFSVIPRIGILELDNYFNEVKKRIVSEIYHLSYRTFSHTIFGNNYLLSPNNLISKKYPCPKLLHSFLTAIFPEILNSYCSSLSIFYSLGDFSEEEINFWNDYYNKHQNHSIKYYPGSKTLNFKDSIYQEEINQLMQPYYSLRRIPTKREILKLLETPPEDETSRDEIFFLISQKQQELKEFLYESQAEFFDYQNDQWKIYYKYKDRINFNILDFTLIKGEQLREESKKIVLSELKDGLRTEEIRQLLNALSDLEADFKIKSFNDIKAFHLISYYHMLETNETLKPTTLKKVNHKFKVAFDHQISLGMSRDNINIARHIRFYNIDSYYKKTETIPEEILNSLLKVIEEAPTQVNLIFRLLLETGWRFNEIIRLTPECFKSIEAFPDYIQVTTTISKTASSRKNSGLGEIHTGFITKELYEKLKVFIEETSMIREKYSIETCFYSLRNGFCEQVVPFYFNYNIKQLIKKHGITDEDGKLWSFSSRQLRKTTTVELIDAGIPLTSVQKQLGHLHTSTTEKYYAEVNKERLKDKNNKFFSETVFSAKDKSDYDKEERTFSDLNVSVRKLFGSCLHPFSQTLCPKIKEFKCFECPRFYTCKDYKSELILIKNNLEELWKELINYYEEIGIVEEEYSESEEFKVIQSQLKAVSNLLEQINA